MKEIIKKLNLYRLDNNLSQEKIAKLLNVSFVTVNRWCRGKAIPNEMQQSHIKRFLERKKTVNNLIEHAKREFKILGYIPLDEAQESDPNKWIQQNVLELIEVFSKQGHSGSSAPFCINYFKKLANFEPLKPIAGDDSEWGASLNEGTFQNQRLSSVFKEGEKGKPYYLDAIVWSNEKKQTFTGSAVDSNGEKIKSRQYIKLPFLPKTFYVDVIDGEPNKIVDDSQLNLVFEYYDKYENNLKVA